MTRSNICNDGLLCAALESAVDSYLAKLGIDASTSVYFSTEGNTHHVGVLLNADAAYGEFSCAADAEGATSLAALCAYASGAYRRLEAIDVAAITEHLEAEASKAVGRDVDVIMWVDFDESLNWHLSASVNGGMPVRLEGEHDAATIIAVCDAQRPRLRGIQGGRS